MQLVEEFDSESLRGRPVTAARFVAAVKYCFHDYYNVPQTVYAKPWQVNILRGMYLEPLPGSTEKKQTEFSVSSANSMFALAADLRVSKLHPWIFSSVYTFAYFVIERRRSDRFCKEAYNAMLKGDTPTTRAITHIINSVICDYGDKYAKEDEQQREGLTEKEIDDFLKLLSSISREELKAFMIMPKHFIKNYYRDMEHEMCIYFKLIEINSNIQSTSNEDNSKSTKTKSVEKKEKQNRILTESLSYNYIGDCNVADREESSSTKSTYSLQSKQLHLQKKDQQELYSCTKFSNFKNEDENIMEIEEFSPRSSNNIDNSYINLLDETSDDEVAKSITNHIKNSKGKTEDLFSDTNKKLNSLKDKNKKTNFFKYINKSRDFSNGSVKLKLTSKKQSHENNEENDVDILKNISNVNELNSSGSIIHFVKSITNNTVNVQDITRPIIFSLFRKYREWKMNRKRFKTNSSNDTRSEVLQSSKKLKTNSFFGFEASDSKITTATSITKVTNLSDTGITTMVQSNGNQIQEDTTSPKSENVYQSKNKTRIKMCSSFQCSICLLKFSRKDFLQEHIWNHNKKELQNIIYKNAVTKAEKRQKKLSNEHKNKKHKGSKSKKKAKKNKNLDSNKCSTKTPLKFENGIENNSKFTKISASEHPIIHRSVPHVVDSNVESISINQKINAEDHQVDILKNKFEKSSTSTSENKTPCANTESVAIKPIELIILDDESNDNSKQEQENLNQEQSQLENKKQPYIRVRSITELQNKVHLCCVCEEIFYSLAAYERHKIQHSCTGADARQNEGGRLSPVQMHTPLALVTHANETSLNESQKILPEIRRQSQVEPATCVSSNGTNNVNQIQQSNRHQIQKQSQNNFWFVSFNSANT